MKRYVILGILVLSLSFTASAQEDSLEPQNISLGEVEQIVDESSIDLEEVKEAFNSNTERVPSFAASLIGDQTLHIELAGTDLDNSSIGVKMEDMEVTDIQWEAFNGTTLEITVSQENLQEILSSPDPMHTAGQMLKQEDIEYRTVTFTNKIRFGLLKLFTGF